VRLSREDSVADGKHTGIERMQAPGSLSTVDRVVTEAQFPELRPRDHSVLCLGQAGDPGAHFTSPF